MRSPLPPSSSPGAPVCIVMIPAVELKRIADEAGRRGLPLAEAISQAFQQWLGKEGSK